MDVRKERWLFRLYVAGPGVRATRALENLDRLCRETVKHYRIDVIDLLKNPAAARDHEIVAVPTVVREEPVPIRKAVGDLSDFERVRLVLSLR